MRSIRTVGAGFAVAIVMVIAALSFTPSSADASSHLPGPSARVRDGYGAISISVDGATGTSRNYPTKQGAYKRAVQECRKVSHYPGKCVKAGWVRNACAAVWFRLKPNGLVETKRGAQPHYGWAVSLDRAIKKARGSHKHGGHIAKTCT